MENVRRKKYFDYSLLFIVIFLLCLGLIMLYSTSSYSAQIEMGSSTWFLFRQLRATLIGLAAMAIVILFIDTKLYKKFALLIYLFAYVLLFLTLTPLGIEANGATRWVGYGGFSIQPAEYAKLAVIIYVASLVSRTAKQKKGMGYIFKIMLRVMPVVILVYVLTKNLSSALIIFAIAMIMVFVASEQYKPFVILTAVGVVAIFIGLNLIGGFRGERIESWRNPELYSQGTGYQVIQGLYAIGSGGLFGKGLGQSIQKLGYIPEAQNDMIFAIICEELGLIGAIAVTMLFIFMIWRFMVIAKNASNIFESMMVIGIMGHIAVQVILNIAVVTNTIPNTGITLPFISYGGTSIVFLLAEMGIALRISRGILTPEEEPARERLSSE